MHIFRKEPYQVHVVDSPRSIEEVGKSFSAAAGRHGFSVLAVHNLKQSLRSKGLEFDHDCLVFEVCNPRQAKLVLDVDLSLSAALPCRVAIYKEGGRTKLAALNPTAVLGLYRTEGLSPVAEEVEHALNEIMREAAGALAGAGT